MPRELLSDQLSAANVFRPNLRILHPLGLEQRHRAGAFEASAHEVLQHGEGVHIHQELLVEGRLERILITLAHSKQGLRCPYSP